jgi:HD-GYP domain-containing protein (c-di-GMP phosphodiesterase class II)
MRSISIKKLLDIGVALSREKDSDKLLSTILISAMDITNCDGGTLYILKDDQLHFKIMITTSKGIFLGGKNNVIALPPVPLDKSSVSAAAAIDKKLINIVDVYENDMFDFSGPRKYDRLNNYRTESMLVIPMENDYGDVIGVLQLINAKDEDGNTVSFLAEYERVVMSLASQAAISLTNVNYAEEVQTLLDSFVKVMSTAIDERTPYNANHTRNMVNYAEKFIAWINKNHENGQPGKYFSDKDTHQLLMSIWLHDIGKLIIPLEIMDKDTRLGARLFKVLQTLDTAELTAKIAHLEGRLDDEKYSQKVAEYKNARALVKEVNSLGFLTDEKLVAVNALSSITYETATGDEESVFTDEDIAYLSIKKGTLTSDERAIMESHVAMTEKMLSEMTFSKNTQNVPLWAPAHHEYLNGDGYPYGKSGDEIPWEVRMITIVDIFDALTARDRPYKPPMSAEQAFQVLDTQAEEGQIDKGILELFKQSEAWK